MPLPLLQITGARCMLPFAESAGFFLIKMADENSNNLGFGRLC